MTWLWDVDWLPLLYITKALPSSLEVAVDFSISDWGLEPKDCCDGLPSIGNSLTSSSTLSFNWKLLRRSSKSAYICVSSSLLE